jgi:uncharacterized protein YdhG (YjbR/CyaY superfamily)
VSGSGPAVVAFVAFGIAQQALLLAFFAARRWAPQAATRLGWSVYAFGGLGVPLAVWLLLDGQSWELAVGPLLMAAWALLGAAVDLWRPREWRRPLSWGVFVPYLLLYFWGQMFLWWPLWDIERAAWAIYLALFVPSTVLNILGHGGIELGARVSNRSARGTLGAITTNRREERPVSPKSEDRQAGGFSDEERAAMKERAAELMTEKRRGPRSKADGDSDVLAKIAELPEPDRQMATRLHELVRATAPELAPKTWYGMPAYALKGKVVCFFQGGQKFGTRYATLGFSDTASLDDGDLWPTSFAVKELTPAVEERIVALVTRAVSGSS